MKVLWLTAIMFLTGCMSNTLEVGLNGKLKGSFKQNRPVQQISFYPDGTIKEIQYWKVRPKTAGWFLMLGW